MDERPISTIESKCVDPAGRHGQTYDVRTHDTHVTMRFFGAPRIEMPSVILHVTASHIVPLDFAQV
jgi:hypothetical protein